MIIDFIKSGILANLFFSSIIALISVALYPKSRSRLIRLPCQVRSKVLAIWLLSPFCLGAFIAIFGLLPSLMDRQEIASEHCYSHINGIAHLCWFNPIVHLSDVFWLAGILVMALVIIFNAYKFIAFLINHWHFQTTLEFISQHDPKNHVFQIASDRFFAFSSGLFAPRAFMSSRLIEKLSPLQYDVVIAHEQAHCRRHDVLQRLFLAFAGLFHFPGTRQQLISDLELAHEQICDDAAVQKVGDRYLVAETIVKIARQLNLNLPEQKIGISSFDGSHIDIRIQQLLEQPKPITRQTILLSALVFSLFFCGVLTLTMPLHHLS